MGSKVFWTAVFGFLFGVYVRSFISLGYSFALSLLLIALCVESLAYIGKRSAKSQVLFSIALFACALGIARMGMATLAGDPLLTAQLGHPLVIEGFVLQEPDVRETSVRVYVRADTLVLGSSTRSVSAGVLAALPAHSDVAYGDRVRLNGTLEIPQPFDTGAGRSFAYPEYLGKDGIAYEIGRARSDKISDARYVVLGSPNYFAAGAIALKQWYLHGLQAVLPEPEAGLAAGIMVGDKRSVGPELTATFQRDSLIHMLVLSGYNITVVLDAIGRMLSFAPRYFAIAGSLGAVIFFILMSGGAASAVRAGLMALIAVYARTTGRVFIAERALGAVVLLMVLWNPWTLCFDPSFQLSVLATLGLILFTPLIEPQVQWATPRFGVREVLAATIATQLTVLPLLLYQSGTLSLVALPANLFALAPVPLAMFFALIAGLAGALFGGIGAFIATPAYALLSYIVGIARLFAMVPFAAVTVPAFPAWVMASGYAILFAGYFIAMRRVSDPEILPESATKSKPRTKAGLT